MSINEFREGVHQIDDGSTFHGWWRACLESNGARLFLGLHQSEQAARDVFDRRVTA